ncbi:MAG: aspartate aminotransferase family protein [Betaproteobacteria bacterium]|nr:aspartate aminotransferase family protein [Betaproteobacteria bacterium]MBI2961569.1 aspartate aminotransferase family protein [Betaproteobacteria bacterium]
MSGNFPDTTLDLRHYWMPFTANRSFKAAPRLLVGAKGVFFRSADGREIIDSLSGLWCVPAGHGRPEIRQAIVRQFDELDYAPPFQMGHPVAFEAASRIASLMPAGLDRVFFANSGSEAVDTALKIALAYHRARGEPQRTLFVGRQRGYHGVNFGGMSVGGMPANRKAFAANLLPRIDQLPSTYSREHQAYSRGQPEWGAHLADYLETNLIALHDASNIAAVIVEPVAGSGGVLAPPKGYLERLREICTRHGILLIFDEVITGFGRLGAATAAERFGVTPDLITFAKGVNNGMVPLGGVVARQEVHDAIVNDAPAGIELFHGYTYSGHPLAVAAACAAIDLYEKEALFARASEMESHFQDLAHALKGERLVQDIRSVGLAAGIDLEPRPGAPGARGYEASLRAFDLGMWLRASGDTLAIAPPLVSERAHLARMFETLREALKTLP